MILSKSNFGNKLLSNVNSINASFIKITKTCIFATDVITGAIYIGKFLNPLPSDFSLIASREDFLHLMSLVDEVEIDEDGNYSSKNIKGKLNTNSEYNVYDGLVDSFDTTDMNSFKTTEEIVKSLKKTSVFTNPGDPNPSFRMANIKEHKSYSSSNYRMFLVDIAVDGEFLIGDEPLRFILSEPNSTVYMNKSNTIVKTDNDEFCFRNNVNATPLPMLEDKIKNTFDTLLNSNFFKISKENLKTVVNFLSYYAKSSDNSVKNNGIIIEGDGSKINASVGINSITLDVESVPTDSFKLPLSIDPIMTILSSIDSENYSIFYNDEIKIILIVTDKNDKIAISKVNI